MAGTAVADRVGIERLVPGTGELPLAELLALMPEDIVVSVEVPQRSLAEAGMAAIERVSLSVKAARELLGECRAGA